MKIHGILKSPMRQFLRIPQKRELRTLSTLSTRKTPYSEFKILSSESVPFSHPEFKSDVSDSIRNLHVGLKTLILAPVVMQKVLKMISSKNSGLAKKSALNIVPRREEQQTRIESMLGLPLDSLSGFSDVREMDILVRKAVMELLQVSQARKNIIPSFDEVRETCERIAFDNFGSKHSYLAKSEEILNRKVLYAEQCGLSPAQVDAMHDKISLEIEMEQKVLGAAIDRYSRMKEELQNMGKLTSLTRNSSLLLKWVNAVANSIVEIQKGSSVLEDHQVLSSTIFKPYLFLLEAETYAVITVYEMMNILLKNPNGVSAIEASKKIGLAIQHEVNYRRLTEKNKFFKKLLDTQLIYNSTASTSVLISREARKALENADWSGEIQMQVGAGLLDRFMKTSAVEANEYGQVEIVAWEGEETEKPFEMEAVVHSIDYRKRDRQQGRIRLSEKALKAFSPEETSGYHSVLGPLPMVIPPLPWKSPEDGGYFYLRTKFMRTFSDSKLQKLVLKRAQLDQVYKGLNILGETPWRINTGMLDIIEEAWYKRKLNIGKLPVNSNETLPEMSESAKMYEEKRLQWQQEYRKRISESKKTRLQWLKMKREAKKNGREISEEELKTPKALKAPQMEKLDVEDEKGKSEWIKYINDKNASLKRNSEIHSLRCDLKYKLDVADEFRDLEFYFPYNVDFRGRAYPISPHLNHLGNDICRSLLIFSEKQPLGERGFWWLKVHICNLFGNNKIPVEERALWTEEHRDSIIDSARNPLDGHQLWLQADAPWQFLSACIEIDNAWQSGSPETFRSGLPIHQDGSCNGLQHYAALARDTRGAEAVNLVRKDKPQDVYSEVLTFVVEKVKAIAEREIKIAKVKEDATADEKAAINASRKKQEQEQLIARLLVDKVNRKTVKQTVMTSVYGVTFVGAADQILKRVEEWEDIHWPGNAEEVEILRKKASRFLAKITLQSIGDLFTNAKETMSWLTNCAKELSRENQPVCWITPLGLPVVQPYRDSKRHIIDTAMQRILLVKQQDYLPVSKPRQSSAFPPNYVHSLDSTHMLKTAIKCNDVGITFAAVHDSYWTHANTVDTMNRILREEFVDLHSTPLLQNLRDDILLSFPTANIPQVPELGSFDLEKVIDSPYFFN